MLKRVYIEGKPDLQNLLADAVEITFPDSPKPVKGRRAAALAFGRSAKYWKHVASSVVSPLGH